MGTHPFHRIRGALVLFMLVVSGVLVAPASPALSDVGDTGVPTWGVFGIATNTETEPIRNLVFAIEQIGDRIYVGGKFIETRPYKSGSGVAQPYLAAFNADTGQFVDSFRPDLNGPVYSLQASPDGSRLFAGGEFTSIDGDDWARGVAALDPQTGTVDTSWRARLTSSGGARPIAHSLTIEGSSLYVAGRFDHITSVGGQSHASAKVAKLAVSDGSPNTGFATVISGGSVWGVAAGGGRVYLAGYHDSVDGNPIGADYSVLDANTGRLIPAISDMASNSSDPNRRYGQDIVLAGDKVFWAGSEHVVRVIEAATGRQITAHSTDTGGDYQDLEVVGARVYASCHCYTNHHANHDYWLQGKTVSPYPDQTTPIHYVAAYSAATGAHIPSFHLDASSTTSGVWAIHGSPDGCLWVGGDLSRMTLADGSNRSLGGFGKFCGPPENPSVPPDTPLTATFPASLANPGVAQMGRLYQSAFGRLPDQSGMAYWVDVIGYGHSLPDIAQWFLDSYEFQTRFGGDPDVMGHRVYVEQLYLNVLGRPGEESGINYWTQLLDSGAIDPNLALFYVSESAENMSRTGTGFRAF